MRRRLKSAVEVKGPGARSLARMAIAHTQRTAQRVAFRRRHSVLKMDTWLEEALSFSGSGIRF